MLKLVQNLNLIEKASGQKQLMLFHDLIIMNPKYRKIFDLVFSKNFRTNFCNYKFNSGAVYLSSFDERYNIDQEVKHFDLEQLLLKVSKERGYKSEYYVHSFICEQIGKYNFVWPSNLDLIKWVECIVNQDMHIGIQSSRCRELTGEKEFGVMLAHDIKKVKNVESKLVWPIYIQPKLDGYRCIAMRPEGIDGFKRYTVDLFTRNGSDLKNFKKIQEHLIKYFSLGAYILDGEIMSSSFQSLQQKAFTKDDSNCDDACYHVFDIIDRDDWNEQVSNVNYSQRDSILNKMFISYKEKIEKLNEPELIKLVPTYVCASMNEVHDYHKQFTSEGYEGTILRADTPYEWKRTRNLLKMKDMDLSDCRVLSTYSGTGKYKNALGGITVEQENGLTCDVGSGFDDSQRLSSEFREGIVGKIVEIKHQGYTENNKMRFPIFQGFRHDKE